ncbi:C45 family autoproteolytic acyltransferase/hydolase [Microbacterium murale]|uniref:Isopenicillin-N N-acyltransferase-like protein n=1 Tax=Microbacterium murale TaxID=1081040 RepID=A0ABU0PDI7_9MICO|nr:C45 family peptidase [Microbacterium murale]MDQ0644694.1 isopenicillin-N N-acyltransferase-like protein [Microbacterium murale]
MIVHEWTALTDDEHEEGRRFGRHWAPQLAAARDSYLRLFAQSGVPDSMARDVADACRTQTEVHAPEVAAEFQGMAEGSGLSLSDVYLLTARTEILARMTPSMECSTVVHVPSDGTAPRTLQTWDWHETLSNETVVRRFRSRRGTGIVTFSEFGQPAKIGVNDRGLGLHFNILHHRSDGSRAGVPVHVLARMILDRARSIEDAADIARSTPLGASSVLTVATFDGRTPAAAAIEVAPAGVAVIETSPGHTLAHTNHFLDEALAAREYSPYETTSVPRYQCLVDAVDQARIIDDRERALAFGAIPDAPISVRARPEQPEHLRWETKLTVALDVVGAALAFASAAPADVGSVEWRRISVDSAAV